MGAGVSSVGDARVTAQPNVKTDVNYAGPKLSPSIDRATSTNLEPDNEKVDRLVQTISRQNKYADSRQSSCVHHFDEQNLKNQESVYILKQLYKRMDPAVMKTMGEAKGEVKLSFKYDERREMLLVKVVGARDLSAKDIRGKSSDPYVKMEVLPDTHSKGAKTTQCARNTLRPMYNEIFTFELTPGDLVGSTFRVQVLSHDPLGKDDFMGERIISLSELDLSEIWTSWFQLNPETDLDIQGDLDVSLSYELPDTLVVTIHGATDFLCRDPDQPPDPYVRVIVSGIPKGAETPVLKVTPSPTWEEAFEYTLVREELIDRHVVFHVLDKSMTGGTDVLGQAYIDLGDLDTHNGFRGKLGLADLKNSKQVGTHYAQSATVQEFKEAMYAHSVYKYPCLLFKDDHRGNKVLSVTCRKAGSSAKVRLIDGLPT